eukprot:s72_g44.t1
MDPGSAVKAAHTYSEEDFLALWSSVREFILIETLDHAGKGQGHAVVQLSQAYQADQDGAFGAVGKQGIVHVLKWVPITRGASDRGALRGPDVLSSHQSKSAPTGLPRSLERGDEEKERERSRGRERDRQRRSRRHDDADRSDSRRRRRRMAQPVTPPREPPPVKSGPRKRPPEASALDAMLEEEAADLDSEKLDKQSELKLASLREQLAIKKGTKAGKEPGAILASRAAAVAESSQKKKKKAAEPSEVLRKLIQPKKVVKEEADYGDGESDESSSDSDDSASLGEGLGGSLGSKGSASTKQRKLRQYAEKHPGRLLTSGFRTMHDQIGSHFGGQATSTIPSDGQVSPEFRTSAVPHRNLAGQIQRVADHCNGCGSHGGGQDEPCRIQIFWTLAGVDARARARAPGAQGSPFDVVDALSSKRDDVIRCPVRAGESRLEGDVVDNDNPGIAQAEAQEISPEHLSDFHDPGVDCTVGARPHESPIQQTLFDLFQCQKVFEAPIHEVAGVMMNLPPSSLQLGISLAQLLLGHPRDGKFIHRFLAQTWTDKNDTPTRRDMMPFMFNPSVGAAVKLIGAFPVRAQGVIQVDSNSLSHWGRQQRKKIVTEGTKQLWRWLTVMVLNGEFLDWSHEVTFTPAKPSLGQVAALEMIGEMVNSFIGDPLLIRPMPLFQDLMLAKSIDYAGEEISHALPLRLEELLPGLPDPSVGDSLDALSVVDKENRAGLEVFIRPDLDAAYVCSAVIPMGWINAVSLFQHLHRRLGMAPRPLGAQFAEELEWRRDRAVPQPSDEKAVKWVQYYLDDAGVVGFAASEIDKECRRLVSKRWPGVIELGGVDTIDEKLIHALIQAIGFQIDCFLISAGSPCQDLTILLAGRKGLEGSRSRLFFEIPRIYQICQQVLGSKVVFMVENVYSMTAES